MGVVQVLAAIRRRFRLAVPIALVSATIATTAQAGEVTVAVAANFTAAAKEVVAAFKAETGHRARLSFGSTGKLFAQIVNGAPFDVYLAADQDRPKRAAAEGWAVAGSRFTYAVGKIVLFSTDPDLIDSSADVLAGERFNRLAVGNPKTAPYGAAAVEALKGLGLYDQVAGRLVYGDNIAQTYQFVATGNAELGFVAAAQIAETDSGSRWPVPEELYTPIRQDAVLLSKGAANDAARAFMAFLGGPSARAIIARHGYGTE